MSREDRFQSLWIIVQKSEDLIFIAFLVMNNYTFSNLMLCRFLQSQRYITSGYGLPSYCKSIPRWFHCFGQSIFYCIFSCIFFELPPRHCLSEAREASDKIVDYSFGYSGFISEFLWLLVCYKPGIWSKHVIANSHLPRCNLQPLRSKSSSGL